MATKLDKMGRFLPGIYKPETNTYVRGLLYAWSFEDDTLTTELDNAKDQIYVKHASLQYLDALGSNVGVFRPATVNLSDESFRNLIPALSFDPKQIRPTIKKVLDAFFGVNNPRVAIGEVNPNEIVIQIPSSVPSLRRFLKGSHHFHNYAGDITAIDNISKTVTIDVYGDTKLLATDEIKGAKFAQGNLSYTVLSNSNGDNGVIIQFAASTDLSALQVGKFLVAEKPTYRGSFIPDPTRSYTVTRLRGTVGQNIVTGNIYPSLIMQDASGIPDAPGRLIFGFTGSNQEVDIKYFGRPNNTTLLIDPSYVFTKDHSIGEIVNVIVKPYVKPDINGKDLSVYLVEITKARLLAQDIVKSVVAAGVTIRWIVVDPKC